MKLENLTTTTTQRLNTVGKRYFEEGSWQMVHFYMKSVKKARTEAKLLEAISILEQRITGYKFQPVKIYGMES